MGLWGKDGDAESRPKFLPVDSNAGGSSGAREHAIAVAGGWGLAPGLAASGNDNKAAQPEVLVCIRNLAEVFGSATPISIGFTEGEVGNTGTFDITVTFDEAVDVTSAAWSANQTVTNKAFILLSRLGVTDMVEDNTMACQYFSGSGTNQLTFRGTAATNAAAGFLGFNGSGHGDAAAEGRTAIVFNGTADITEEDGGSILGLMLESGTRDTPGDKLIMDSSAGTVMTVNGALAGATTLVVDAVSGATLVVGQVITVKGGAASISDSDSETGISTDNSLTITAVASQTSVTISEAITVADDIVLLASTNGGDEIHMEGVDFTIAGSTGTADITDLTLTGGDSDVNIALETDTDGGDGWRLVQDTAAHVNDSIDVEDYTSDIVVYSQAGSSSNSASVLNGVTVAAAG